MSDDLGRRARESAEFFHGLAEKLEFDYAKLRTKYLDDVAFHRMVDLYRLEQPAWSVTFRARLEAERFPVFPEDGIGMRLDVVPTPDLSLLQVHLREQYDGGRPLEHDLQRLLQELQAPTGAVRFVTASLRPEGP